MHERAALDAVEPGATVAVIGCGGVGLSAINGADIAGAGRVIAIDTVDSKLELARKFGAKKAEEVRRCAEAPAALLRTADDPESVKQELLAFDAALKAEGLNPGTSADLTVASLFAARLEDLLT